MAKDKLDVRLDSVRFSGPGVKLVFVTDKHFDAATILKYLGQVVKLTVEESQMTLFPKEKKD